MLVNGEAATVYVLKDGGAPAPRFKAGDFVRIKCVYSPQFDRDGNLSDLTLWTAKPADLDCVGSLDTDPRFTLPIIPSEAIREDTPTNDPVHVRGVVHSHEPGKWVTLWDATGQVMVQSTQSNCCAWEIPSTPSAIRLWLGCSNAFGRVMATVCQPPRASAAPATLPEPATRPALRLAERIRT